MPTGSAAGTASSTGTSAAHGHRPATPRASDEEEIA